MDYEVYFYWDIYASEHQYQSSNDLKAGYGQVFSLPRLLHELEYSNWNFLHSYIIESMT